MDGKPRKRNVRYARLHEEEDAEPKEEGHLRRHEIYDGTYYIPNTKVRVLEIPMNSSLSF